MLVNPLWLRAVRAAERPGKWQRFGATGVFLVAYDVPMKYPPPFPGLPEVGQVPASYAVLMREMRGEGGGIIGSSRVTAVWVPPTTLTGDAYIPAIQNSYGEAEELVAAFNAFAGKI